MQKTKILAYSILAVLIHIYSYSLCGVAQRDCVEKVASSQIGVRELTGRNDGPEVKKYLSSVHLKEGYAWCAAFVNWCFQQCNIKTPCSAWVPTWLIKEKIIYNSRRIYLAQPQKGDLLIIYDYQHRRPGHIGIIEQWTDKYVTSIEGNTNSAGSREGDGVYRKIRPVRSIYAVVNIID